MIKPINQNNAIESMTFAIVFEQSFDDSVLQSFLRLESALSTELPSFNKMNKLEVRLDGDMVDNKDVGVRGGFSGVVAQSFLENGARHWALTANENTISATCFYYDSWEVESVKAMHYIREAATSVRDTGNSVRMVVLRTIDKFLTDLASITAEDPYQIARVFNAESDYITKHAVSSGPLWHVFQGWFEDINNPESSCLNTLNLSSANRGDALVAGIDHNCQLQLKEPIGDSEKFESYFEMLHDANKRVIRNVLSDESKNIVGL